MKPIPCVIATRDGTAGLEVMAFDGTHGIPNRDALGFYFTVRLTPDGEPTRLAVLFSGTVLAVKPRAFGLPELGGRDDTFSQFSLAAIGDYLDEHGLPDFTPSGVSPTKIECFSPHFQSWVDRTPASDAEIEQYLTSHAMWSWKYDHGTFVMGMPDALRLRQGLPRIGKIVKLYDGELWRVHESNESQMLLEPAAPLIKGTARRVRDDRVPAQAPVESPLSSEPPAYVYVDEARIADLRRLNGTPYDLTKVVALCEELNICYRSQCYHAVAALVRALMDHVPPIFGCKSFNEVANNYPGAKSFKECMQRLDGAARKIADAHLHTRIRASEVLPTRTQVNFSNEVDFLLAEIVRVLKQG